MSMVIDVEGLAKRYGAHLAVDDVGFAMSEGEIPPGALPIEAASAQVKVPW